MKLPRELEIFVNQIDWRRDSVEVKNQKKASLIAVLEVVLELVPNEIIQPLEARFIYQHEHKFGNFRWEMARYCWEQIEGTPEEYFPEGAADRAKEIIIKGGYINSHNLWLGLLERNKKANVVSYLESRKKLYTGVGRKEHHILETPLIAQCEQVSKIREIDLEDVKKTEKDFQGEVFKIHRNFRDRTDYGIQRDREIGKQERTEAPPLLIKKRRKGATPDSKRAAVMALTAQGTKQTEIAARLDLTERRVKQIQDEFRKGQNMDDLDKYVLTEEKRFLAEAAGCPKELEDWIISRHPSSKEKLQELALRYFANKILDRAIEKRFNSVAEETMNENEELRGRELLDAISEKIESIS